MPCLTRSHSIIAGRVSKQPNKTKKKQLKRKVLIAVVITKPRLLVRGLTPERRSSSKRLVEVVFADRIGHDGQAEYLIKWVGLRPEEASWLPYERLTMIQFTDWIRDRLELEDIIAEFDGHDPTPNCSSALAQRASKVIGQCIENEVEDWSQGGPIYYR